MLDHDNLLGHDNLLDHDNLEVYSDAVNYDAKEVPTDDGVAFYCALAQEAGGSVLEIACGTGRVTIPVAKLGPTTGLDIVPGMLAHAKSKSAGLPIRWVEGDARTFDPQEQFHFIFLTGNAFQAFVTNTEQAALLQRLYAHLHNKGLFAFETRNLLFPTTNTREGVFPLLEARNEDRPPFINADEREVRESTTQVYDHVTQILHLASEKRCCW